MKGTVLLIILYFFLAGFAARAQDAAASKQQLPDAKAIAVTGLQELYGKQEGSLIWYCPSCEDKRMALIDYIRHSDTLGLEPNRYLNGPDKRYEKTPDAKDSDLQKADEELSKIALHFAGDLYAGADRDRLLSYDEVSPAYASADMSFLVQSLSRMADATGLINMLSSLQPATTHYLALKSALQRLPSSDYDKRYALITSMNYYRWIHHFGFNRYIVVNIPAASLHYHNGDGAELKMRTVVGTPEDRTPRFASHVREISLYPYWNMPRNIIMDEWFDLIKDNRAVLDYHELEIVDNKGAVIPYENIKWKSMNNRNFPYRIRQKTGCANPLGVVKFGMNNPYDVYLHDTPGKGAFDGKNRYYSHGCVRVEDAIGLAQAIVPGKVDERYLKACFSDQQPQVLQVPDPVPVFIVYMTAVADASGNVIYYKDMYKLLAKAENRH